MTRLDRRALFASGSAAALLASVGISAEAAPVRGGHLRAALSGGDRSESWLDLPGGRFLQAARAAVFETLTEIAADGTLQPGLAKSWSSDKDGHVWHFALHDDVLFHNGERLIDEDVVASLQTHGFAAAAVGDGVSVTLDVADPAFPLLLAGSGFSIFRAEELRSGGFAQNGTGLYRIKRFEPGRSFAGQRVDAHRKDGVAGWFDLVEFVSIADPAIRAEAVRDGIVEVADLNGDFGLGGRADIRLIEDYGQTAALRQTVRTGSRTGVAPLDDMRFSERWWSVLK